MGKTIGQPGTGVKNVMDCFTAKAVRASSQNFLAAAIFC
jgi:hypothetical protein